VTALAQVWTPGEVTVVEGVVTVLHMPVLMVHAYLQRPARPLRLPAPGRVHVPCHSRQGHRTVPLPGRPRQAVSDMWVPEGVPSDAPRRHRPHPAPPAPGRRGRPRPGWRARPYPKHCASAGPCASPWECGWGHSAAQKGARI